MSWHVPHQVHSRVVAVIARHGAVRLSSAEILVVPVPAARGAGSDEFHLPGSTVASGEHAERTLVRGIRAGFGFDVAEPRLLGTLTHSLSGLGEGVDEVTWVYRCDVVDPTVYGRNALEVTGAPPATVAVWMPAAEFAADDATLLPGGALALILGG